MISSSKPDPEAAPRRRVTVHKNSPEFRRTDTFTRIARERVRLPRVRMFVLAGGLLLLAALGIDIAWKFGGMNAMGPNPVKGPDELVAGSPGRRYTDPAGRFSVAVPEDWTVREGDAAYPDDAVFRGPDGVGLHAQVNRLELPSFGAMLAEVRKIEEQFNLETQIKAVEFKGRQAIERNTYLMQVHLLILDVMDGEYVHHVRASCPRGQFEKHEAFMRALLATYAPNTPGATPAAPAPAPMPPPAPEPPAPAE